MRGWWQGLAFLVAFLTAALANAATPSGSQVLVGAAPTHADGTTKSPLLIDGKPIDTLCLLPILDAFGHLGSSPSRTIDLDNCRRDDIVNVRRDVERDTGSDMVGVLFDYREGSSGNSFFYRYVGEYRGSSVLLAESYVCCEGADGDLVGLKRNGNLITFNLIDGGWGCYSGVENARIVNGHLSYDQDLTPADFMALSLSPSDIEHLGFGFSYANCVATIHKRDSSWSSITLKPWSAQTSVMSRADACFDEVSQQFLQHHASVDLDRTEFDRFTAAFNRCVVR